MKKTFKVMALTFLLASGVLIVNKSFAVVDTAAGCNGTEQPEDSCDYKVGSTLYHVSNCESHPSPAVPCSFKPGGNPE